MSRLGWLMYMYFSSGVWWGLDSGLGAAVALCSGVNIQRSVFNVNLTGISCEELKPFACATITAPQISSSPIQCCYLGKIQKHTFLSQSGTWHDSSVDQAVMGNLAALNVVRLSYPGLARVAFPKVKVKIAQINNAFMRLFFFFVTRTLIFALFVLCLCSQFLDTCVENQSRCAIVVQFLSRI